MKRILTYIVTFITLSVLELSFANIASKTPHKDLRDPVRGLEIANMMEKNFNGFRSEKAEMELILKDAHGTEIKRKMRGVSLELPKEGDRTMMTFLSPFDVRGTKLLTWSHEHKDDDQWLYLPSLKRPKRISSSGRYSSFMGSEFSYEDLGGQQVEKYNFYYLRDQKFQGDNCYVLERVPKKDSAYSKQIVYISKKYLTPLKIEYFDQKNELQKIAVFNQIKNYEVGKNTFFRASKVEMKNIKTKKESIFVWAKRSLGVPVKKKELSKSALK